MKADGTLIQAADIHRELSRLMGRAVLGFSYKHTYDVSRDKATLHFGFEAENQVAASQASISDLAMSLDEFSRRILQPMVGEWRASVSCMGHSLTAIAQDMPEGCVAGWISEEV